MEETSSSANLQNPCNPWATVEEETDLMGVGVPQAVEEADRVAVASVADNSINNGAVISPIFSSLPRTKHETHI